MSQPDPTTDLSLENCERLVRVLTVSKPNLIPAFLRPNQSGLAPLDALAHHNDLTELRLYGLIEQDSTEWTRLGRRVQGIL